MTTESPQRTHKPSSGHAPASAWAATSTMSGQSGLIWISTGSRSQRLSYQPGLCPRTGAREYGPRTAMVKLMQRYSAKGPNTGNSRSRTKALSRPSKDCEGNEQAGSTDGPAATTPDNELDQRILDMEKAVGTTFYRNVLREYGRVNQPKLIRDAALKQKVLQMLEAVARWIDRLEAVTKRIDPSTVEDMLAKLQAPPLGQIADIRTLQRIVVGLEELAGTNH